MHSNLLRSIRNLTRPSHVGINVLKSIDKEGDKGRYPTLQRLNVETHDKVHRFSASCDQVVKFIKLGAINKTIALQYCHYLAELARTSQDEDRDYYGKRCGDLVSYLFRQYKDMPSYARAELLCDVSNTSEDNCKLVYQLLDAETISKLSSSLKSELITACYKFNQWERAQSIITKDGKSFTTISTIPPMVDGVIAASQKYIESAGDNESEKLKLSVTKHIVEVLKQCQRSRTRFSTKRKAEFIQALRQLNFEIQINPTIKVNGRCTSCDTRIPLFEEANTERINVAINDLILKGSDKGLFINAAPQDSSRFKDFLDHIFREDRKPLDCVIDGLNIAYRNTYGFKVVTKMFSDDLKKTIKLQDPESQARILINIIIRGNFLRDMKKILVVGKSHMSKWPGLLEFFDQHKIHFFPTYNNSRDDLFQLFASTLNPKTKLVTNDFLRDHLAQLRPDDRDLLERWIDTHQVWIHHKTMKPLWPTPCEKIASVNEELGYFHIPIIDGNMIDEVGKTEPPPHVNSKILTWICCRYPNDKI